MLNEKQECFEDGLPTAYNNNNNIYLTAIEFSPGGSGITRWQYRISLNIRRFSVSHWGI